MTFVNPKYLSKKKIESNARDAAWLDKKYGRTTKNPYDPKSQPKAYHLWGVVYIERKNS